MPTVIQPYKHVDAKGTEVVGYSYPQAQEIIGAKHGNYVRQLVSQGKIKVAGRMPTAPDSEVFRTLLSVTDVETYAKNFRSREEDSAHTYEIRLDNDQLIAFRIWFADKFGDEPKVEDLTEKRRTYSKKSAPTRKANKKAKKLAAKLEAQNQTPAPAAVAPAPKAKATK